MRSGKLDTNAFDAVRPVFGTLKSSRPAPLSNRFGRPEDGLRASVASNGQSAGAYSQVGAGHAESLLLTDLDYFEAEIEKCRQRLAMKQPGNDDDGAHTVANAILKNSLDDSQDAGAPVGVPAELYNVKQASAPASTHYNTLAEGDRSKELS